MPFLLQNVWQGFHNKRSAKLETRPSASQVSCTKTPKLLGFHDQVDMARAENFTSSLTINVGIVNNITDLLLKHISQGWSEQGLHCSLPGNNYPEWLVAESEGSSVFFKVPQVIGRCLQGIIFCIIYSSPQDSIVCVYPVSVMIKNFTKATIEFYKRDAETTCDDEEWKSMMCNLEPGNEVEVIVAFACKFSVKKTAIYLVYGKKLTENAFNVRNENENHDEFEWYRCVNEVIKGSLLTQHEQGRFQRGQLVLERLKLKFEIKSLCLGLLKRVIQHLRATTSLYAPIHMGQPRRVKTKTLQCGAALCDVVAVVLGQVAPTSGA
ncbi:TMV resistance protein N-like [Senna tora]|uniref:TMV resistance protein N-like n=1 Tax=Senna tora TaxID=362788 RepID=A0A834XGR6_9FABA|nr:TMV resistance protein N-like [Senna tora]